MPAAPLLFALLAAAPPEAPAAPTAWQPTPRLAWNDDPWDLPSDPPGTLLDGVASEDVLPEDVGPLLRPEPTAAEGAFADVFWVGSRSSPPPVTLTGTPIAANFRVGTRPLGVWHAGVKPPKGDYVPLPKPFLFPLYTPAGVNAVDYASADHPHHKGVWVSVDEVELDLPDGARLGPFKHWVEDGRIDTVEVELKPKDGAVRCVNHWLAPDGTPVLVEETTITAFAPNPARGALFTYDITLSPPPGGGTVTIGDTKEGFVGVRMAPALDVKRGRGVITNSEGGVGEEQCWGQPAAWCDCSAPATAEHPGGGVALFDHPGNFRKARYHARGYGLMAVSPFGPQAYSKGEEEAAPVAIPADAPLRLRYGVYVHDGDAAAGGVADASLLYATAAE